MLSSLTLLKWRDEQNKPQKFFLKRKVSAKWRDFGELLGLEHNELEAWSKQYQQDADVCWGCVMQHWLDNGSDNYPVSWEGLCELLEDAEFAKVAGDLRKVIKK